MSNSIGLVYLLSGGTANIDPAKSVGGSVSGMQMSTNVDSLFSKVESSDWAKGSTDYRCVYVVNNGTFIFTDFFIWVENGDNNIGKILIGIPFVNEVQQIAINRSPSQGAFALLYTRSVLGVTQTEKSASIAWNSNSSVMAGLIQTALNNISLLAGGITVTSPQTNVFTITFAGVNGKRAHNLLQVVDSTVM